MNWDYKYGRYTVRERWDQMMGKDASPFILFLRYCVLAFAVFTASSPEASYYVAPYQWVIGYLAWYWYPS